MSLATVITVASDCGRNFFKNFRPELLLIAALFSGCQQDTNTYTDSEFQSVTTEPLEDTVQYFFDASCDVRGSRLVTSQLESKLNMLSKLDDQYKLTNSGSLEIEGSIFYGMHQMHEDGLLAGSLDIPSYEYLMTQIVEANFIGIRGGIAFSGGNLYPSAGIEEYIFSSASCAIKAEEYLAWVNSHGPWGTYYKTPTIILRDKQVIYHIIGAGEFMRGQIPLIASVLASSEG